MASPMDQQGQRRPSARSFRAAFNWGARRERDEATTGEDPFPVGYTAAAHTIWLWVLAVAVFLPCGSIFLFAFGRAGAAQIMATGVVLGCAGLVGGALIGFIFGVPRVLTGERPVQAAGTADSRANTIVANTNLEEISDWLTKILVGVGLTQFRPIVASVLSLFAALGPAFGGDPGGTAFAGGLLTYAVASGFVSGWLVTRLRLNRSMAEADRLARQLEIDQKLERAIEQGPSVAGGVAATVRPSELDKETRGALESIRRDAETRPATTIRDAWRLVRAAGKRALGPEATSYNNTGSRMRELYRQGRISSDLLQQADTLRTTYYAVRNNAAVASSTNASAYCDLAEQVISALADEGESPATSD
jgi:hypothetical protein